MRHDGLTVIAVAVLASCAATVAHEGIGHGVACFAHGGAITQLSSVYFACSAPGPWIAAGGPIGNLAAAAIAGVSLTFAHSLRPQLRLFLILTLMISLSWFAGYLIYSALALDGDMFFVARDLFGAPELVWRVGWVGLGVVAYAQIIAIARSFVRQIPDQRRLLALSWIGASLAACVAALAYAPGVGKAVWQATLEIGAASLPTFALAPAPASNHDSSSLCVINRSPIWIAAGVISFTAFFILMGRGFP